jgi:enoyl-CoA hydratase
MPADFKTIRYERPSEGVARIVLARPEMHNAQNPEMLYEINDAYYEAAMDDTVKVLVLAADGDNFSSGHDLAAPNWFECVPAGLWGGLEQPGAEGFFSLEHEVYLDMCWRWRNMPKPTIAAVQGKAIAGGLMLIWVCDLIVAAEDARFSDPVVAFGLNGHEYFVHPFEMGARKAKEMLFTAEAITAQEAEKLGMVNRVVPKADLEAEALALAERIARLPMMGLKMAKQSVNQALDAQGMWTTVQSAFSLHQLTHSHNMQVHGLPVEPSGIQFIKEQGRASR